MVREKKMAEKKRILVVEDEMDYAKMVKMRLESAGYEVSVAGDAYSGTHQVVKNNPDLVVLDLNMPAGGGFALLERIRKIPSRATIPVVILTGRNVDEDLIARAETYDVSAIFSKPYDASRFLAKIASLLRV